MSHTNPNTIPLHNIYAAFKSLGQHVTNALQSQLGDAARLAEEKRLCLLFL